MGYRQVPAAREAFLLSHGDARNARPEVGGGSRRCSPVPWPFPPRLGLPAGRRSLSPGERSEKPRGNCIPPAGRCGGVCKVFLGSTRFAAAPPSCRDALGRGGGGERPGSEAELAGPACLSVVVWFCVC